MKKILFLLICIPLLTSCDPTSKSSNNRRNLNETCLEREIRQLMEKGVTIEDRKQQVPVIEAAFAKITTPERARNLAALCFTKTLGTQFTPMDLAEIALAETGDFKLSSKATSPMGAVGVWQLMPKQARIHGYSPEEMRDDEKCAEAAVKTLDSKMEMANGNLDKAKRYYCGAGPEADAYLRKIQKIRKQLRQAMNRSNQKLAMNLCEPAIR
jgi:Transglycosylase SLT domain